MGFQQRSDTLLATITYVPPFMRAAGYVLIMVRILSTGRTCSAAALLKEKHNA